MKDTLNVSFKFNSIKNWFNENYFICLYDRFDNYITSFDTIEDTSKFFNKPIKRIIYNLRNGIGVAYNHKYCKLICMEKDKEDDFELEERGKKL